MRNLQSVDLKLGEFYDVSYYNGKIIKTRMIKVTRKGFNLLNLLTNRCLLHRHLYMTGMGDKEFTKKGEISGKFLVHKFITVHPVKV
jgi:hypothetical protein